MNCPLCGTAEFYEGLTSRDCRNAKCELYARTETGSKTLPITGKIKIGGREYSFGSPPNEDLAYRAAYDWMTDTQAPDLHRRNASILYDVPEDQVTPEQRAQSKRLAFGARLNISEECLRARLVRDFRATSQDKPR